MQGNSVENSAPTGEDKMWSRPYVDVQAELIHWCLNYFVKVNQPSILIFVWFEL